MRKFFEILVLITTLSLLFSCGEENQLEPLNETGTTRIAKVNGPNSKQPDNADLPLTEIPNQAIPQASLQELTSERQIDSFFDKAFQFRVDGQYETALSTLSRIEAYPMLTQLQKSLVELQKGHAYRDIKILKKAKLAYERAIELNPQETNAMLHLSDIYSNGFDGIELDVKKSWYYLDLAAELGDLEAIVQQGIRFRDGIHTAVNQQKAFDLFYEAYQTKSIDAMVLLADFYATGEVVQQDKRFALELLNEAYQEGNITAIAALGNAYYFGELVEQDLKKAFDYYKESAEKGNINGMSALGVFYDNGIYTEVNIEKAVYWFSKAADNGDATSMVFLGMLYENERGVYQDYQKAFDLYSMAAKAGDGDAMAYLGNMYLEGIVVEQNSKFAFELFSQSSAIGNARGHFFLGNAYEREIGVGQDLEKAILLYKKGVALSDTKSLMSLGQLYEVGLGVEKDLVIAEKYFVSALELGEYVAYMKLANWYRDGTYYEKNHEKAKELYEEALNIEYPIIYAEYALLLAISTQDNIRNGSKAVEYAEKATSVNYDEESFESLAAAYAANAQFEKAVEIQTQYLNYLIEQEEIESIIEQQEKHLAEYKNFNARYDY